MPKARLQYAIAIDAALAAMGLTDPVVHIYGSSHGQAMPFVVKRGWAGPQGSYVEEFRIVRSDTRVTAYRSAAQVLELRGEFYTDGLEDRVTDVELHAGEYELVFTVDNEVIPGVPVFVEPGPGAAGGPEVVVPAIVDEATKKSDLVWIELPGKSGQRPAWHLWQGGSAYVICGGDEQQMPGLADEDAVVVHVRSKDKGGLVVAWRAAVGRVTPGTAEWNEVVPLMTGIRLNLRDADNAPARWAKDATLLRLTPTGELVEGPGNLGAGSRSAPPVPSPAATETRIPITLHKKPVKKH